MGEYDVIIIGGGLSGLAAAIRLAHFGQKVRVFERHGLPGGLNSWYPRPGGGILDTGLHALTNFVPAAAKDAPLNRVLRQLRLKREALELCPQAHSVIAFPGSILRLNNDFAAFRAQVEAQFPQDQAGFAELLRRIDEAGYTEGVRPWRSALSNLRECLSSQRLIDLLCLPVMYYGNAHALDMDFHDFAIMFKSVIEEGFARPRHGMKPLIDLLVQRAAEEHAELTCSCGIQRLAITPKNEVAEILDDHGETHTARHYLSTIGAVETASLCEGAPEPLSAVPPGQMGFLEAIFELPRPPAEYGFTDCIAFYNRTERFSFAPPAKLGELPASLLACAPDNYVGAEPSRLLRLSTLTPPAPWLSPSLPREEYRARKAAAAQRDLEFLKDYYPGLAADARFVDAYTPRTIRRFSGHCNGVLYGSAVKLKDGATGLRNLTLAGTDQGLVGIIGALLSGILAANAMLQ